MRERGAVVVARVVRSKKKRPSRALAVVRHDVGLARIDERSRALAPGEMWVHAAGMARRGVVSPDRKLVRIELDGHPLDIALTMTCIVCGRDQKCPGPGCLPSRWSRFELRHSNGLRKFVYFCPDDYERIPAGLRESRGAWSPELECSVCHVTARRVGIDSVLPEGWVRLEVVVDGQVVYAGGWQGSRAYFCPLCGPGKVSKMLASFNGTGGDS